MYPLLYELPDLAALLSTSYALISVYCEHFMAVQRSQSGTTWNLMCLCKVHSFLLMGLMFYGLPDIAALLATAYALTTVYCEHFVVVQRPQSRTTWNLMCTCKITGFSPMDPVL